MRKDPSLFIGAAGLLCLAISGGALYLSRHPEVANRFAPAANAQASVDHSPEEITGDAPSEPGHFLSEQAIAQEYHRHADLPFNIAPAGTKNEDKKEDEESPLPGHAPKNRLPGKIVFAEETQESSEFDALFKTNKAADEEEREMPYAIEELEGNKPSRRFKVLNEQAGSEDEDDGVADVLDFIGNHRAIINLGLSRMGFPVSFLTIEKCDRHNLAIETPLNNLLAGLFFQDANELTEPNAPGSVDSGAQLMDYCTDEGEEKREMPHAEEESAGLPPRVGQIFISGNGYLMSQNENKWILLNMKKGDCPEHIVLAAAINECLHISSPPPKNRPMQFIGFIDSEGSGLFVNLPSYFETIVLPEILPWVQFGEMPLESIDTIWPLNLLNQPFLGLISYLVDPNRRMTEMDGLPEDTDDKPSHISPERVHGGIQ